MTLRVIRRGKSYYYKFKGTEYTKIKKYALVNNIILVFTIDDNYYIYDLQNSKYEKGVNVTTIEGNKVTSGSIPYLILWKSKDYFYVYYVATSLSKVRSFYKDYKLIQHKADNIVFSNKENAVVISQIHSFLINFPITTKIDYFYYGRDFSFLVILYDNKVYYIEDNKTKLVGDVKYPDDIIFVDIGYFDYNKFCFYETAKCVSGGSLTLLKQGKDFVLLRDLDNNKDLLYYNEGKNLIDNLKFQNVTYIDNYNALLLETADNKFGLLVDKKLIGLYRDIKIQKDYFIKIINAQGKEKLYNIKTGEESIWCDSIAYKSYTDNQKYYFCVVGGKRVILEKKTNKKIVEVNVPITDFEETYFTIEVNNKLYQIFFDMSKFGFEKSVSFEVISTLKDFSIKIADSLSKVLMYCKFLNLNAYEYGEIILID